MAVPTNRAQAIQYWAKYLDAHLTGTYEGDNVPFRGKTWGQVYLYLMAQPAARGQDPKTVADKVLGLWATQQEAQKIAIEEQAAAAVVQQEGAAAASTDFAPSLAGIMDALKAIASVFEAIYTAMTDGKMWRSFGWIVLGILLLVIGVLLWLGVSPSSVTPAGAARAMARRAARG